MSSLRCCSSVRTAVSIALRRTNLQKSFPAATLIPVFLQVTLPEGVNAVWAEINVACAVVGLLLSILCVKSNESRSPVNIASTIISAFWCLMMVGIATLALFITFCSKGGFPA